MYEMINYDCLDFDLEIKASIVKLLQQAKD
jgi:hypothetical protein